MAGGLMKSMVVIMVIAVASFQMQPTTAQTRHVVGDSIGWTVPAGGATDYANWASRQTFRDGDTLVFNFVTGAHDVTQVSEGAFGSCNTANSLPRTTTGPATITLTAGSHYYVCSVGTHCQLGQKLNISVAESTSATPPASSSPTPAGNMPPPSPPSPSSGSTFSAVVPVTFLAAVLAFFY